MKRKQYNPTAWHGIFNAIPQDALERANKIQARETEYIQTVHAYNEEHGTQMPLEQATALYEQLKLKYA